MSRHFSTQRKSFEAHGLRMGGASYTLNPSRTLFVYLVNAATGKHFGANANLLK
jgi:hypothetical protein